MPRIRPIRIRSGPTGWILVELPYTSTRLERIKTISGRAWNPDHRCWAIPRTARTVDRLRALFSGDELIVDPELLAVRHAHPGRRPPIHLGPGSARDALQTFAETLRQEGYSPHTIAIYSRHAKRFFKTVGKTPAELDPTDVRNYLNTMRAQGAETYYSQAVRSLKSLLSLGLHKSNDFLQAALPPRRAPRSET